MSLKNEMRMMFFRRLWERLCVEASTYYECDMGIGELVYWDEKGRLVLQESKPAECIALALNVKHLYNERADLVASCIDLSSRILQIISYDTIL
jgi:hypothetical protein